MSQDVFLFFDLAPAIRIKLFGKVFRASGSPPSQALPADLEGALRAALELLEQALLRLVVLGHLGARSRE